jgi:Domain of unknown function (DUF4258)
MADEEAPPKPILFVPRPETVEQMVRRLAADTSNIKWSKHALTRMHERGITDKVAIDVLRRGSQKGATEGGDNPGEWKVKMTYQGKGRRDVGVVVITVRNARLFVKTVEWEDLR